MSANVTPNIYILLYRGKSWVSKLIRFQTRSVYSHASLYVPKIGNFEAWHKGGVRCTDSPSVGHTPGTPVDAFRVTMAQVHAEQIIQFVQGQVGKDYDFRSVFRFLTRRPEHPTDKNKWFCSELVFAAFEHGGIKLLERIEPWAVSPAILSYSPYLKWVEGWKTK